MTSKSQTREAPALSVRAQFEPSTLDREKRTVEVTWSAGARVLRGFWDRFWEELSLDPAHVHLDRLNNGAPYLANHDSYSVVDQPGVVERAWLTKADDGTPVGRAKIRFIKPGVDAEADRLFEKIADGIVVNTSVGYRVHKFEKIEDAEDGIPVMRATSWTPHEVSSVSIGADDGAGVRSASPEFNSCEVITRGKAPHEEKRMADENMKTPAPAVGGSEAAPPAAVDPARAVALDRERQAAIRAAVRKAQLDEGIADKLVNDGTTLDAARGIILDKLSERTHQNSTSSHVRIEGGEDQVDKFMRGAEAWLIRRSGKMEFVQAAVKAGKTSAVESDPGEFRGLTLIGLAREFLERRGVNTRRLTDERIAELALQKRSGGMQTASDFPVLLENVTYKVMLGAYETTPHEWSRFCARGSVANFHAHTRYRAGAFGILDDVNDHGELKNKAIPDGEKRQVTIGTKGNIIAISRKTLIQDDMGVFTNIAPEFGRTAQNTIEYVVWSKITANGGLGADYGDGNPLFHSSRSNINTTASALSIAGLDADRSIMRRQNAPAAQTGAPKPNIMPAILVVAAEYGMTARSLNTDEFDHDSTKLQKRNPMRGVFKDIIDSTQLTGTRRYLFADPAVNPVIEVTFLQGQEAPQMESEESFAVLGLRWRLFMDFGVNLVDYRGSVTNAGS